MVSTLKNLSKKKWFVFDTLEKKQLILGQNKLHSLKHANWLRFCIRARKLSIELVFVSFGVNLLLQCKCQCSDFLSRNVRNNNWLSWPFSVSRHQQMLSQTDLIREYLWISIYFYNWKNIPRKRQSEIVDLKSMFPISLSTQKQSQATKSDEAILGQQTKKGKKHILMCWKQTKHAFSRRRI